MEVWKWLVLWSTAALCCHGHVCIHDKIAKETIIPRVVGTRHFSRLPQTQATPYQGIRIAPLFMELEGDSGPMPEETNEILQDVVDYMNTALMVPKRTYYPGLRIEPCAAVWNVGPAKGKCAEQVTNMECGSVPVPKEHIGVTQVCDPLNLFCHTVGPDGPGVQDADYILYVTYTEEICEKDTLAYGGACFLSVDENMRPSAGMINLCPTATDWSLEKTKNGGTSEAGRIYLQKVISHEIFHALGFGLFDIYVDEKGNPDSPIAYMVIDKHLTIPILTSSKVKEVGREYYDCSDLQGVPLEDEGGEASALSHWEMRALYGELMVAALDPLFASEASISKFTLAALEDSGWYKANYEATSENELHWGKGQGCEFPLSGYCPAPYTCSTEGEPGCTFDYKAMGTCSEYSFMNGCQIIVPYYKDPETGESVPGLCEKNQMCATDDSPKCI